MYKLCIMSNYFRFSPCNVLVWKYILSIELELLICFIEMWQLYGNVGLGKCTYTIHAYNYLNTPTTFFSSEHYFGYCVVV